jgi:hypothetical protein
MKYIQQIKNIAAAGILSISALALQGCPTVPIDDSQVQYDLGFAAGFLVDEEYWQGFDDSYDTVDAGPIYYSGGQIPVYEDPPYDAGYWDGVWFAYNDGYFVAYDYAFTIGFSEGYDLAFYPDYEDFLENDPHIEFLDGGFTDGYNDGFSEGRVFGAFDYADGLDFDWLDAMLDYRSGTDVEIAGVSTGLDGPVELYEYGTDPNEFIDAKSSKGTRVVDGPKPSIRSLGNDKAETPELSYRDLTAGVRTDLSTRPDSSPRDSATALRVEGNWLARIEAYRAALAAEEEVKSVR